MKKASSLVLALALVSTSVLAGTPPKSTPDLLAKGKATFTTNCVACHGEKGDGNTPAGQALNPKPRNFVTEKFKGGDKPADVFKTITEGRAGTAMAAFKHLSEDDRWGLVYYVLSFKKK